MRKSLLLLIAIVGTFFVPSIHAQGFRIDQTVLGPAGIPLPGAAVALCTFTATQGNNTTPCSPLALTYTDSTLTTLCNGSNGCSNPGVTDGLGNYAFWVLPQNYQVQFYGPGFTTLMKPISAGASNSPAGVNIIDDAASITCANTTAQYWQRGIGTDGAPGLHECQAIGAHPIPRPAYANLFEDIAAHGGVHGNGTATALAWQGSISSSSTALAIDQASDFSKGQGIFIARAGPQVTVTTPAVSAVQCKGPVQVLQTGGDNNCGSTTVQYAVAVLDVKGGLSRAVVSSSFTHSAPFITNWIGPYDSTHTYATGDGVWFGGNPGKNHQIYVSLTNGNIGNNPMFDGATHWALAISPDNFNWIYGTGMSDANARGVAWWRKIGSGAWVCGGASFRQNEDGDNHWYIEDHALTATCPPWWPSDPTIALTAAADYDPLITTVAAVSGTSVTTANAASHTVSALAYNVWHDESAAVAAAILAAGNANLQEPTHYNPVGSPCVLIAPAGENFISHIDMKDIFGGYSPSGILKLCPGSMYLYNMPILSNTDSVDWDFEHFGGGQFPGNTPLFSFYSMPPMVSLGGNGKIHGYTTNYLSAAGLEMSGTSPSNMEVYNIKTLTNNGNEGIVIGGNSIRFYIHNIITLDSSADSYRKQAGILFSNQFGGTINNINIDNVEMFGHGLKVQGQSSLSGSGCQVAGISLNHILTEGQTEGGFLTQDGGFPGGASGEGCALGTSIIIQNSGSADPNSFYPSLLWNLNNGSGMPQDVKAFNNDQPGVFFASILFGAASIYDNYNTSCNGMNVTAGEHPGGYAMDNMGCQGQFNRQSAYTQEAPAFITMQQQGGATRPVIGVLAQKPYWTGAITTGGGGSLAAGRYYYTIAGVMADGSETGSLDSLPTFSQYEHSVLSGATATNHLSISVAYMPTVFANIRVYRSPVNGGSYSENVYYDIPVNSGTAWPITFNDTGAAPTGSAAPKSNNSAFVNYTKSDGNQHVPYDPYDITRWNTDAVPTKKDVRDKIESVIATAAYKEIPAVDFATSLTVVDGVWYYTIPPDLNGKSLVFVSAQVITTGTTGSSEVQISRCSVVATGGACTGTVVSVLSTTLHIDSGQAKSTTASIQPVINGSNAAVATDQIERVDVKVTSGTAPKGLILQFGFQ